MGLILLARMLWLGWDAAHPIEIARVAVADRVSALWRPVQDDTFM